MGVPCWHSAAILLLVLFSCCSETLTAHASDDGGFPFEVNYRPLDLVKGLTENVTLRCAMLPDASHPFLDLSWIKLLKEHRGGWMEMAKVDYFYGTELYESGITGNGSIHNIKNAFLEVSWPVAVDSTFGIYKCLVQGFLDNFDDKIEETSEILIKAYDCSGSGRGGGGA